MSAVSTVPAIRTSQLVAILSATLFGAALFDTTAIAQENPVFTMLTQQGVQMPDGSAIKLPPPSLPDGLDAAGQRLALEKIADPSHPVESLTRKSVVAPLMLKMPEGPSGSAGRRVDLWFIAYGDLKQIGDEALWEDLRSEKQTPGGRSKVRLLSDEELQARKIAVPASSTLREYYGATQLTLFDRVRLNGTAHNVKSNTDESVLMAMVMDPRFAGDANFPNQWRPITRNEEGLATTGAPQLYAGAGSYVKVTKLIEPAGALLVEYHAAFNEPIGWFNGANLLRSKLPIAAQDGVRRFRRSLMNTKNRAE